MAFLLPVPEGLHLRYAENCSVQASASILLFPKRNQVAGHLLIHAMLNGRRVCISPIRRKL
jgi:hypothetical protein